MPKPVVRGRRLVVLARLSADKEYVLLGMARDGHKAVVGNLLKLITVVCMCEVHTVYVLPRNCSSLLIFDNG